MSHFTVMVIGNDPETQLAPFNENLIVEKYLLYTKEQLIENTKDEIARYKASHYDVFLNDPDGYKLKYKENQGHLNYIEKEFPTKLAFDNDQLYLEAIRYYDNSEIGINGAVFSEYNPNSKWDWYELGGRWSGMIKLKDGATGITGEPGIFNNKPGIDCAKKADIKNLDEIVTFALLMDGKWYEKGKMGWFAITIDAKPDEQWASEFKSLLAGLADETMISIYDCHI